MTTRTDDRIEAARLVERLVRRHGSVLAAARAYAFRFDKVERSSQRLFWRLRSARHVPHPGTMARLRTLAEEE